MNNKPFPYLPGFDGCTINMAAEYLGVNYPVIYKVVRLSNCEEITIPDLLKNGYHMESRSANFYTRDGVTVCMSRKKIKLLSRSFVDRLAQTLNIKENVESCAEETSVSSDCAADDTTTVLTEYSHTGLGAVRTILVDGAPWFVANDVCQVLEINNPHMALRRLDPDEKSGVNTTDPHGRAQITNIINEPGLYSLILASRKPQAKAFKRWITHEVIPAIRKTGSYSISGVADNSDVVRRLEIIERQMSELLNRDKLIASHAELESKCKNLEDKCEVMSTKYAKMRREFWFMKYRDKICDVINQIVKVYAGKRCYGKIPMGWGALYNILVQATGIDLRQRKADSGKKTGTYLGYASDLELADVMKAAMKLIESIGLTLDDVLDESTAKSVETLLAS